MKAGRNRLDPGMFFRLLTRAARLRKGQAASAIIAIMVAAAASTAMLNLFTDVQAKLRGELRRFGANVVVEAKSGQSFSPEDLKTMNSIIGNRTLAVPFAYLVARTEKDQPVVVGATSLGLARELNPWWAVSAWPQTPGEALVGVRAAKQVGGAGARFSLALAGHRAMFRARGTVQTGGDEDSRIYISLDDFHAWTGLNPTVVAIAATGNAEEVMAELQQAFPSADVRPVRQIRVGEARVLGKTRSTLLFSSAFIIATAALCVIATLTGWVFDRRYDFAIMKALGASDRLITLFILAEASLLGALGALLGFGAGLGLAAWIGRVNFHASIAPRWSVLLPVLLGCLLVTLFSTLLPLRLLRRIQPAMILRGE
jgi:putative ABC transport system permease protein